MSNDKKQTAIEWLIDQVNSDLYQKAFGQTYISIDLVEKAKELEKGQIKYAENEAYLKGLKEGIDYEKRKYKKTYNQ